MMLPSRLGCPLSLKTAHMGNPGLYELDLALLIAVIVAIDFNQELIPQSIGLTSHFNSFTFVVNN